MNSLKYRPELDGLRSVAVVAVILYHADFLLEGKNLFPGGFIGVDVFFVISGYLITLILLGAMGEGRFSFADFYERRARRILPALFTVMLVSIPFAWLYMLPNAARDYAGSILSSLAFVSNFWFFSEDSYWAAPSALKPFLHTWSLSIEEQFYLIFPLALLLLYKYAKRHITTVFITGFLLSLVLADVISRYFGDFGFYLLPTRGWELLAGALLARFELQGGRRKHSLLVATMPTLGLLLICYAIFMFNEETPHPSLMTLIPIIGTMLLIWFTEKGEFFSNVLGSRPLVSIGLISYSLYLWHFPVFVFAKMAFTGISVTGKIGLISLALVLSIASYRYIERPARNKSTLPRQSLAAILVAIGVLLVLLFTYMYTTSGAMFRYGAIQQYVDTNYWRPENEARFSTYKGCWLKPLFYNQQQPFKECRSNENLDSDKLILVIGDSHAAALIPGLIEHFGSQRIVQRVVTDCRPYAQYFQDKSEFCVRGIRDALADIRMLDPGLIILGGAYLQDVEDEHLSLLLRGELNAYQHKMLVMGPLPRWGDLTRILVEAFKRNPLDFQVPQRLEPAARTFDLERRYQRIATENGVGYLSPVETFCRGGECLVKVSNEADGITAWDDAHLTHKASMYLVEKNYALINGYLERVSPENRELLKINTPR